MQHFVTIAQNDPQHRTRHDRTQWVRKTSGPDTKQPDPTRPVNGPNLCPTVHSVWIAAYNILFHAVCLFWIDKYLSHANCIALFLQGVSIACYSELC